MRGRLGWLVIVAAAILWTVGLRVAIRLPARSRPFPARREESQEVATLVASLPPIPPPSWTLRREDAARLDAKWVVALLRAKRTAELEAALEAAEDAFEANTTKEPWIEALFAGFGFAGARDLPVLDDWVARSPRSFVGYVARAAARMADLDGASAAGYVPGGAPSGTSGRLAVARRDLERALEIRPAFVGAHAMLLHTYFLESARPPRNLLDAALAVCRACLGPRVEYAIGLRPELGGSREEMTAFSQESQAWATENPRLRALGGYADWDDCTRLTGESHLAAAGEACDRAIRVYPMPAFLRAKAALLYRTERYTESAAVLSRVLEVDAFDLEALVERARAYTQTEDWEKAALDLRLALELRPENDTAVRLYGWLIDRLDEEARAALRSRDLEGAFTAYGTAARVVPEKASFRSAHDAIGKRIGLLSIPESAAP